MATPPAAIHDWIAESIGSSVERIDEPLAGASTATVWPVAAAGRSLIVKVYDLGIDGVGADDVRRDAVAMRAAAECGLVAPRVLAADESGERLGSPAIVMTRLDGEPRAHGRPDPQTWVDGLADALITVSAAPSPRAALPERRAWFRLPVDPPSWTSDAGLWRAMNDALAQPIPASTSRFIHRDFHQLNVMWSGERPVGLVDWVNGCLGPIESDIACGRLNIALAEDDQDGFALADRFLARCRDAGLPWHPLWDLEWLAGAADVTEVFLQGVPLGAQMTLAGVRAVFDEGVRRSLVAAETWTA